MSIDNWHQNFLKKSYHVNLGFVLDYIVKKNDTTISSYLPKAIQLLMNDEKLKCLNEIP